MNIPPRTVAGCTLLVMTLGPALAACGGDGNPLSAAPYDAADQISVNAPEGDGKKADPDKPLEITAEDSTAGSPMWWPWTPQDAMWRANWPPTAPGGTAPHRWPQTPATRSG
jgi:predicted small lipoprotein YifL